MAFTNGNKQIIGDELLNAQTFIWKHMLNFINSFSLKCALQLGIPDVIHKHDNPMPLAVLVEALAINKTKADSLHHLMRLLVHSGFFIEMPEGYVLTPASHLLLKDNPFSISPPYRNHT
ncbi:hypothetical protein Leryth_012294 [Lithospermum erythrorhizon]|nr:hypothetical protein Leryth_012294 [Lithospermum erythrorhizon]